MLTQVRQRDGMLQHELGINLERFRREIHGRMEYLEVRQRTGARQDQLFRESIEAHFKAMAEALAAVKQQLVQALQSGVGSVRDPTGMAAVQEKSWHMAALEELRGLVNDCQQEKVGLQARMDIQELERRTAAAGRG